MNQAFKIAYFPAPNSAEVLAVDGAEFRILCGAEILLARRAYSCLVEPVKGDRVIFAAHESQTYILAILSRPEPEARPAELVLPAQAALKGESLALRVSALAFEATTLTGRTGRAHLSGSWLKLDFSLAHLAAKKAVEVFDRLWRRCGTFRSEAKSSSIKAERLRLEAEKSLSARSGSLDLKAESSVKIDGQIIELG
ncbi:MAG: DUF3540 domain-containing protein [Deltaproteobacteria bacterium]|jgi:hypothetical protein|nr:DUF3540 domain-containing protein [Deltaproteobacteria bacterium]